MGRPASCARYSRYGLASRADPRCRGGGETALQVHWPAGPGAGWMKSPGSAEYPSWLRISRSPVRAGHGEPAQGIGHGGDGPGERAVPRPPAAGLAVLPVAAGTCAAWPGHGAGLLALWDASHHVMLRMPRAAAWLLAGGAGGADEDGIHVLDLGEGGGQLADGIPAVDVEADLDHGPAVRRPGARRAEPARDPAETAPMVKPWAAGQAGRRDGRGRGVQRHHHAMIGRR